MSVPVPGGTAARLNELLPAIHRVRDESGILAELMAVFADQIDVLRENLDQLYDDEFVETGAPWVLPYLGELIGYRTIHAVGGGMLTSRSEVANTVGYRRRKGTAAVVEQVARDVTGWPARVVESFETLVTTQYMNHVRPQAQASVSLRDHRALEWIPRPGGGFDDLDRSVDVRRIDAPGRQRPGRYGISKIALFLWRTEAVPLERSPLTPLGDGRRFRFDPLGADLQLFSLARPETDIVHLAEPFDVPMPLGLRWAGDNKGRVYGASAGGVRRSIQLHTQTDAADAVAIPIDDVRFCNLSDASGGGRAHEPPAGKVAIDPVLGRVYLGEALAAGERLLGTCATGMAVPVGAGNTRPARRPLRRPRRRLRMANPCSLCSMRRSAAAPCGSSTATATTAR